MKKKLTLIILTLVFTGAAWFISEVLSSILASGMYDMPVGRGLPLPYQVRGSFLPAPPDYEVHYISEYKPLFLAIDIVVWVAIGFGISKLILRKRRKKEQIHENKSDNI